MKADFHFQAYDVWAYLIPGALVVAAATWLYPHALLGIDPAQLWAVKEPGLIIIRTLIFVGLSYLIGQFLIAQLSGVLLEEFLLRVCRCHPANFLLRTEPKSGFSWALRLFGGRAYEPLSRLQQTAIRAKARSVYAPGEEPQTGDVVNLAESYVRQSPECARRLEQSRNQYALARNCALAAAMIGVFCVLEHRAPGGMDCR